MRTVLFLLGLGCLWGWPLTGVGQELAPAASAWLGSQTNLQTWSADFTQTRTFKTLTQPLLETGHVWFAAPNRFRWELGYPPKTIAVRGADHLLIIYPRLKRVERFPLEGEQSTQWREALALLDAGFPRSQAQLRAQYNLLQQGVDDTFGELVLEPKSAAARRMMPRIKIGFDTRQSSLRITELEFGDGSRLRNDFRNPVLNDKLDPQLFSPAIPADYKVVEPLKKR